MRRHLVLVRHAKSAWDDPSLTDAERPLAPRGERSLPKLRDHLDRSQRRPDVVLCSPSRRTVATLDGIRQTLPKRAQVMVDDGLYLADAATLLSRLHDLDDEVRCAMLIGHNPGLHDLALLLVGDGDPALREALAVKFPTGAAATLAFRSAWRALTPGSTTLVDVFVPRPPRP